MAEQRRVVRAKLPTVVAQVADDDLDVRAWARQYVQHVLGLSNVPAKRDDPQ